MEYIENKKKYLQELTDKIQNSDNLYKLWVTTLEEYKSEKRILLQQKVLISKDIQYFKQYSKRKENDVMPQPWYQYRALSINADFIIWWWAAGVWKSWNMLYDAARYISVAWYNSILFRTRHKDLIWWGSLWETAESLYVPMWGDWKPSYLTWDFENTKINHKNTKGSKIEFWYMERDSDWLKYQWKAYGYIGFDELTHFSFKQVFNLIGRARSATWIKPPIRATCNPDPDSWVAEFISWWIDQETGFPIPERDWIVRYFVNEKGNILWADSKQELLDKFSHNLTDEKYDKFAKYGLESRIMSATFIKGDLSDNEQLLSKDPSYIWKLMSLDPTERAQMLDWNRKVSVTWTELWDVGCISRLFDEKTHENKIRYITCDPAWYWKDLAVIFVWEWRKIIRTCIYTKSWPDTLLEEIEHLRYEFNIPKSQVAIDGDGLGWGLSSMSYMLFQWNSSVISQKANLTMLWEWVKEIREDYFNLKTQCYYRVFENAINLWLVEVNLNECFVDWVETDEVMVKWKWVKIKVLIQQDLRAIKRDKTDNEWKKRIIPKSKQKEILWGRSPDFWDNFAIREFFELKPKRKSFSIVV